MPSTEWIARSPERAAALARALYDAGTGSPLPALAAALLLQCHAATADWSLLAMVALALPGWRRGEAAPVSATERAALGVALAFALAAVASGGLATVAAGAVPVAGFTAFVLLSGRARGDEAARLVALVGVVALLQLLPALVALARVDEPAAALRVAAVPWLVVPNDLAWMACLWPWWLKLARARGAAGAVAVAALLGLQLAAFVLFGSRLAIATAAVATAAALLGDRRGRWLAAATVGGAWLAMLALDKGPASLDARLELWRAALALFREHPLLGVGPGGFVEHYAAWLPAAPVDPRLTPWPHSLPLEVLAQWGVVGAVAVALACAATWRAARARSAPRFPLAPVAIAFACVAAVEASALRLWVWMFAALLLAWPRLDNESIRRTGQR